MIPRFKSGSAGRLLVVAVLGLCGCGSRGDRRGEMVRNSTNAGMRDMARELSLVLSPVTTDSATVASVQATLPFEFKDHRVADSDIARGIGGMWLSLRYEAVPGARVSRACIREKATAALIADGWVADSSPDDPYVLSREYEIDDDDIFYRHGPFTGDSAYVFYRLALHSDSTGRVVAVYFTKGW